MSRQADNITPGTTTLSTAASQVTTTPTACYQFFIQNDPDNTVDVFIGGSAGQPIQLQPGQSITLEINNPSAVYGKAASGSPVVNWLTIGYGQ